MTIIQSNKTLNSFKVEKRGTTYFIVNNGQEIGISLQICESKIRIFVSNNPKNTFTLLTPIEESVFATDSQWLPRRSSHRNYVAKENFIVDSRDLDTPAEIKID